MAFVITGNVWAETTIEYNDYLLPKGDFDEVKEAANKSDLIDGKHIITTDNSYKLYSNSKVFSEDKPNRLKTDGAINYTGPDDGILFNIYAGFADVKNKNEDDDNWLEIKHNITSGKNTELYGAILAYEEKYDKKYDENPDEYIDKITISDNKVIVDGATLRTTDDNHYIQVIGALAQGSNLPNGKVRAEGNYVKIENAVFDTSEVGIYGAESRGGSSLEKNQVEIKNTDIEYGEIAGARGRNNSNAQVNGNSVTIDGASKISCDVYGGLNETGTASGNGINIKGNADVSEARLHGDNGGAGTGNTLNLETGWNGIVGSADNFNIINVREDVEATFKAPIVADEKDTVINFGKESLLIGRIITEETGSSSLNFINGGEWKVTGKSNVSDLQGDIVTINVDKVEEDLVTITNGVKDNQKVVLNVTGDDIGVDVTTGVQTMVDTIVDGNGKSVFEKITDEEIDLKATVDAIVSEDGSVQNVTTSIKPGDKFVVESDMEVSGGLNAAGGKFNVDETTGNVTAETYNNVEVEKNVDGDAIINNVNINKLDAQVVNNTVDINAFNQRLEKTNTKINKVGSGAAALAALHPLDFDPDDKLSFSAGVGNYGGETATALGAFYRPNEKVMISAAGTMGNGENMVNMGVSFALDKTNNVSNSRTAMAREIVDLRAYVARQEQALARQDQQIAQLVAIVNQLTGNTMSYEVNKDIIFPDVPENHWAYEYIHSLAAKGIIEGYPDGNFDGNRTMTRYEFATMLYKAMQKGTVLYEQIRQEFSAELGRIRVDRIKGADSDTNKIERVRVNADVDRDDYGSK